MVTKRARRWLKWGVMTATIAVILILGVSAWFISETIEDDMLLVTGGEPVIDPADFGVSFVPIDVPGPLGNYPAWLINGTDDTWTLFVHDMHAGRQQGLSLLPTS